MGEKKWKEEKLRESFFLGCAPEFLLREREREERRKKLFKNFSPKLSSHLSNDCERFSYIATGSYFTFIFQLYFVNFITSGVSARNFINLFLFVLLLFFN